LKARRKRRTKQSPNLVPFSTQCQLPLQFFVDFAADGHGKGQLYCRFTIPDTTHYQISITFIIIKTVTTLARHIWWQQGTRHCRVSCQAPWYSQHDHRSHTGKCSARSSGHLSKLPATSTSMARSSVILQIAEDLTSDLTSSISS
jgi:hypothetical protein